MSKMSKQYLFTATGIVLSFIIAVSGWMITRKMLDRNEKVLLSATGTIRVNTPIIAAATEPVNVQKNTEDETIQDTESTRPELTDKEINEILTNWEKDGYELPHEPLEGQINMEQAIETGKAGLAYFCGQGVIPEDLLEYEFNKINAYLCVKQQNEQINESINPLYSYWTVSFSSVPKSIIFTINAVTGEIWKAEITISDYIDSYNEMWSVWMLEAFTSYLKLDENGSFYMSGNSSAKSFAKGMFYAVAKRNDYIIAYTNKTTSNPDDITIISSYSYTELSIYLSTTNQ